MFQIFHNAYFSENLFIYYFGELYRYKLRKVSEWCMCVYVHIMLVVWSQSYLLLFSHQACPTFCDPMDCSPPSFSAHGMFQARIQEWVSSSFSRASLQPYSSKNFLATKFWTSFFLFSLLLSLHSFLISSLFLSFLLYIFYSFLLNFLGTYNLWFKN